MVIMMVTVGEEVKWKGLSGGGDGGDMYIIVESSRGRSN